MKHWRCPMCAKPARHPAVRLSDGTEVCPDCRDRARGRKTMTFHEFQRLCFANSNKIPVVEIGGRRKKWVGIGVVDDGPAMGTEVLITP